MSDAFRVFLRAAGCPVGGDSAVSTSSPAVADQASGCPVATSASTGSSNASSDTSSGCSSDSILLSQQAQTSSCPVASSSSSPSPFSPSPLAAAADHAARINMDVVPNTATTTSSSSSSSSSSSNQPEGLDTCRQRSSIPMAAAAAETPQHQQGAAADVWMYPSQQQFYNAMKRKGWSPAATDMAQVVSIHNTVNERAWQHILAWEALHACDCQEGPRLKRFMGKPNEFSPKARLMNFMGFKLPFDRHDWVVDRCGREVRYVIDFYSGVPQPGLPASMHLDVRPALDSLEALIDRIKMQARYVGSGRWQYE